MNRTWKDAACEVAWNYYKKHKTSCCLICFLSGSIFKSSSHEPTEIYAHEKTFAEYRAAFMKWLDENEVKR